MTSKDHHKLFGRTVRGLSWQSASVFIHGLMQLAVMGILARFLTPHDFGLAAIINVIVLVCTNALQMGLGPAIVQRPNLSSDDMGFVFFLSLSTGGLACLLLTLLAAALAGLYGWPELRPMIPVAGGVVFLNNLALVSQARLQKAMNFRVLSLVDLGAFGLGAAATIALAIAGAGAWALVLGLLLRFGAKSLACLLAMPPVVRFRLREAECGALLRFGGAQTWSQVMNQVAQQADYLIVGRFLGASLLGFYERAFTLMSLISQYFGSVLDSVMFPAMAQIQGRTRSLGVGYLAALSTLNSVLLPVSVLGIVLASEITRVFMGPQWTEVIPPFRILLIPLALRTTVRCGDSLARATGRVAQNSLVKSAYAVLVVVLALLFVRRGIVGVAVGVSLATAIHYLMMLILVRSAIGLSCGAQIRAHGAGLLFGGVVLVVSLAARQALYGLHAPAWVVLAACSGLAALAPGLIVLAYPKCLGPSSLWLVGKLLARKDPNHWLVRRMTLAA